MKVVERKTSDPANYAKLGVEAPDTPTAASTLVEVVAGKKTWSLIVGKSAEGRAVYVRKPAEAASALAAPVGHRRSRPEALDRPPAHRHPRRRACTTSRCKPASGPAYLLTRAERGDADLTLSPIPKGRTPASGMSLNGQADALGGVQLRRRARRRPRPPPPPTTRHLSHLRRPGIEFTGRREGRQGVRHDRRAPRSGAGRAISGSRRAGAARPAPATPAGDSPRAAKPAGPDRGDAWPRAPRAWSTRSRSTSTRRSSSQPEDLLEKPPEPRCESREGREEKVAR